MIAEQPFTIDDIGQANEEMAGKPPKEILRWAAETFAPRLTMATAFGAEGCCLIHMLAELNADVSLFNLDTGYQFAETLQLRERLQRRYGLPIELVQPEMAVVEYESEYGGPLYRIRPDQCCHDRKILPLRRRLIGYKAWISAIRSEQTTDRARAAVVQWDAKFGLVKVNPLLRWTKREVWDFLIKNDIPYNPLHDQGFPSIGCAPCTRPIGSDEDERAGRWSGTAKKECGLHVLHHQEGSGI